MVFIDWMRHKGLSKSTILKYDGAINGVLNEWSLENGLIKEPIKTITSKSEFQRLIQDILKLPIFQERNKTGHHMYSSALEKYSEYLADEHFNDIEGDIESIVLHSEISETEKVSLIKSRIGQGLFRQKLINYWNVCSVTKFIDTNLLIASHIKPWKVSSNQERLDHFNGLLLTPNLDKAFDSGLITFDKDGKILISKLLVDPDKLGIHSGLTLMLSSDHEKYMKYHRENVYRDRNSPAVN